MLHVCSLRGLQQPYRFYLQLQEALVRLVQQGSLPDTLLVVEVRRPDPAAAPYFTPELICRVNFADRWTQVFSQQLPPP
jgi:hypothetical protein